MLRKLASVQRVLEILPIENADAIELVRINGWQCVTKKGEFAVGDLGAFLEIDSIPPETETFRFLWTPKVHVGPEPFPRPEKFRIRTMRLRGALSQGLFLRLPEVGVDGGAEGEDLTELIGVGKYEPSAPVGMGEWRAPFPTLVPKTDEMRVQSVPGVLEELRGLPYVITLKYDGTSATYAIDARTGEFHACGRNQSILEGTSHYWQMARKYDLENVLRKQPTFAIQGEIVGPGIQKNPLGLRELSLFAFNVYDTATGRYLDDGTMRAFLAEAGVPVVEALEVGESFAYSQAELLSLAEGVYGGTRNQRDGIVIRPRTEMVSAVLEGRLSFKAISNRYLLGERD